MAEGMSDSTHIPDKKFMQAYSQWADGGWGLIMTGIIAFSSVITATV
jgi:2,4-dienoyl-CoA reductase-like NADH-dependent reductase (Old Yellow Enzyme family)